MRGRGQLERRGLGRGPVLLADGVPDLLAVDRQGARGLDADAHGVADDLHHVDDDVVADHDLLAGTAGDEQHGSSLDSAAEGMRTKRRPRRGREQRRADGSVGGLVDDLVALASATRIGARRFA